MTSRAVGPLPWNLFPCLLSHDHPRSKHISMSLPFTKFQSTGRAMLTNHPVKNSPKDTGPTGTMATPVLASPTNPSKASPGNQPAYGDVSHHHGWTPRSCEESSSRPSPSNQQSNPYMHPNGNRPGFHPTQVRVGNPRRKKQNLINARKYRELD
ncbi:hypothetical protein K470DRAFT_82677 [Piedraia hortae CBS 480.64]|uniref:Uncharacterized protein n=1 Tax=Piedraia hortae CBS 480.64 TaxID=1314780 RepID=A0A6A7C8E7_9PEZI|nr:hypothetical protein K470DRAFT_82677 [Piedraia hortae CBS 480.64]